MSRNLGFLLMGEQSGAIRDICSLAEGWSPIENTAEAFDAARDALSEFLGREDGGINLHKVRIANLEGPLQPGAFDDVETTYIFQGAALSTQPRRRGWIVGAGLIALLSSLAACDSGPSQPPPQASYPNAGGAKEDDADTDDDDDDAEPDDSRPDDPRGDDSGSSDDTPCGPSSFRCDDGTCIAGDLACDGSFHCPDGSDEAPRNTTCPDRGGDCDAETEFGCKGLTCIPLAKICNGTLDCPLGDDEAPIHPDCDGDSGGGDGGTGGVGTCATEEFTCANGQCIPLGWECDDYDDCVDASDEVACTGPCNTAQWTCDNGSCIPEEWKCDVYVDCADSSDELYCGP